MKTEAVVLPHDPRWNEARVAWNLAVDQQPAAVALPESAADVMAVVRWARSRGLRVAPQGTGHNAAAMGSLAHTVLVKTERMRGVEIDAERRIARVEAGVLWAEVSEAAAEHGLAALAGSSPDVGVVGYSLGGGISWLATSLRARSEQCHRRRVGECRRRARARGCGQRVGALLGAPWRRRLVRSRHCARVPALSDRRGVRGRPLLPDRAWQGGAARLEALARGRAGRSHVGRPLPAVPADPGHPGAAARRVVRRGRGDLAPRRGRNGRAPPAAAGARAGHGHVRDDSDRASELAAHGSRASGAGCG